MKISIQTNFPDVQRRLDLVRRDIGEKAVARALNRTVERARTAMSKQIRSEFNVDARYVRERLAIKRASFKGGAFSLSATLEASGRGRAANVIRFAARKSDTGVTVKILKRGPRKNIRGAYIGNKGRTVFARVGKDRLPIKSVQTVDVPQMFNTRRVNAAVIAAINARFPAIFQRELAFAIAQFNAR